MNWSRRRSIDGVMADGQKPKAPTSRSGEMVAAPTDLQWYVLRTKPLAEYSVTDLLGRKGIDVFFPRLNSARLRRGHLDVPLFPSYLFVHHNLRQGWASVCQVPGVLGFVGFDDEIPSIPDEVVSELASRVDSVNRTGGLQMVLRPGDKVYVAVGSTESLAEVVEEVQAGRRVRVLMEFLGRWTRADVPLGSVLRSGQDLTVVERDGNRSRRTRGNGRWIRGFGPRQLET